MAGAAGAGTRRARSRGTPRLTEPRPTTPSAAASTARRAPLEVAEAAGLLCCHRHRPWVAIEVRYGVAHVIEQNRREVVCDSLAYEDALHRDVGGVPRERVRRDLPTC